MEDLVAQAEAAGRRPPRRSRRETVFVSHETYTPARGGSAQAEINALRRCSAPPPTGSSSPTPRGSPATRWASASRTWSPSRRSRPGIVPPVPNFKEVDPSLGALNLSIGGAYPVRYALRLAAGFGSQISMVLLRWTPAARRRPPAAQPSSATSTGSSTAPAWQRGCRRSAAPTTPRLEVVQRRLRVVDTGRPPADVAAPRHRRSPAEPAMPHRARPSRSRRLSRAPPSRWSRRPSRLRRQPRRGAEPAGAGGGGCGGRGAGDRGREDRLPRGHAGPGPRPRGRPRHRHGQAGRGVRRRSASAFGIERDDKLKLRDYPTLATSSASSTTGHPQARRRRPSRPSRRRAEPVEPAAATGRRRWTWRPRCWRWWPTRPATRRTCSTWTSTSKPTSASTPSSRPRCSPSIRERFDIERDDKLKLRDYPTLTHVIGFVRDRAPPRRTAPPSRRAAEPEPAVAAPRAPATRRRTWTWRPRSLRWWPTRPATPPTCWTWTSTSKPTSASTPSSRPRCSPHPRTLRHRTRRQAQAPRLPDPRPRHRLRPRPGTRPAPGTAPEPSSTACARPSPSPWPSPPRRRRRRPDLDVEAEVLAVVADKTGYPADMLDLDLDLEADLGIDTVKQAEVFALIRERFDIERDDKLKLRDYPTLTHVIGFVRDRHPARRPPQPRRPPARPTTGTVGTAPPVPRSRTSTDADRDPAAGAGPDHPSAARRCARRPGVDAGGGQPGRRRVRPTAAWAPPSPSGSRRGASRCSPSTTSPTPTSWSHASTAGSPAGPIHGVYWLAALDHEGAARRDGPGRLARRPTGCGSSCCTPRCGGCTTRSRRPGTFLVTATRLGGRHGYDEAGAYAPLGGAVTGFAKAFARERPGRAGEGGRLRTGRRRRPTSPTCSSRRRCTIRARSRSATPTGCGGP